MRKSAAEVAARRAKAAAMRAHGATIGEIAVVLGINEERAARVLRDAADPRKLQALQWAEGLPYRVAVALSQEGFTGRDQVREAILGGTITYQSIPGLSPATWATVCAWAGAIPAKSGPATMPSEKAIEDAKKVLERAGYVGMKATDKAG